ncbi:hypothetical protein HNR12_000635 [Streptomonospora nanhaiensis]|uniref:Uncharacterized protein n=1 Tax=Streptomonospora nanhaiensis TaxID=1323731 RepID=A0A853BFW0_9ACTN|nr:hypothetical protein [Streptomonospora nanhaiensis]
MGKVPVKGGWSRARSGTAARAGPPGRGKGVWRAGRRRWRTRIGAAGRRAGQAGGGASDRIGLGHPGRSRNPPESAFGPPVALGVLRASAVGVFVPCGRRRGGPAPPGTRAGVGGSREPLSAQLSKTPIMYIMSSSGLFRGLPSSPDHACRCRVCGGPEREPGARAVHLSGRAWPVSSTLLRRRRSWTAPAPRGVPPCAAPRRIVAAGTMRRATLPRARSSAPVRLRASPTPARVNRGGSFAGGPPGPRPTTGGASRPPGWGKTARPLPRRRVPGGGRAPVRAALVGIVVLPRVPPGPDLAPAAGRAHRSPLFRITENRWSPVASYPPGGPPGRGRPSRPRPAPGCLSPGGLSGLRRGARAR